MLNEVLNNNDIMYVANIARCLTAMTLCTYPVASNVRLTTMGTQKMSIVAIEPSCRKADLPQTRDNDMITRKVCTDGNKLCPGKEWRLHSQ